MSDMLKGRGGWLKGVDISVMGGGLGVNPDGCHNWLGGGKGGKVRG